MPFNKSVFDCAPWSMSKAKTALNCPFKFKIQYIDHVKGKESKKSSATRVGIAAHEALEDTIKGLNLKDALQKSAVKHQLTSIEMDDLLALAHNIKSFLERLDIFKKNQDVTEQHIEKKFGLDKDLNPVAFFDNEHVFFRGVWDVCLRAKEKYLIIIDHKTGQWKPTIADYEDQLKLYAIAGVHVFPNVVGVQAAINYLQDESGLIWADMYKIERIQNELTTWFEEFLNAAAVAVQKLYAKRGYWCGFCEYADLCPLKNEP